MAGRLQHRVEDHHVCFVVLGQQDRAAARARALGLARRDLPHACRWELFLRCGRLQRGGLCRRLHREVERGPLPQRALDPDAPTHQLDQSLADRQSETGAAECAVHTVIGLRERLKDPLQLARFDPDA